MDIAPLVETVSRTKLLAKFGSASEVQMTEKITRMAEFILSLKREENSLTEKLLFDHRPI